MKALLSLRVILPLLVLGFGAVLTAGEASEKEIALSGTFNWKGRKGQEFPMDAVLTSVGTNTWKATFTFQWEKKPHTYKGTIKGSLDNGDVSGEATADSGKRTFTFKGRASNRKLTFNHFETTGKKNADTGSGTLQPAATKPTTAKAPAG